MGAIEQITTQSVDWYVANRKTWFYVQCNKNIHAVGMTTTLTPHFVDHCYNPIELMQAELDLSWDEELGCPGMLWLLPNNERNVRSMDIYDMGNLSYVVLRGSMTNLGHTNNVNFLTAKSTAFRLSQHFKKFSRVTWNTSK